MDMFTVPFHQTLLEELTRVLIKLFIKIEKKEHYQNNFTNIFS